MKRIVLILLTLFLLIGVVSASEDISGDGQSNISAVENTDTPLKANETQTPDTPTLTPANVKGKAGSTITLTTTVKNSNGPVKDKTVTFKLNGKTYTAVSDANGVASIKVKCPKSAAVKTVSKTKGKILTKTTKYSKTYQASASVDGITSSFDVVSTQKNTVKKYKVIKKTKTHTFKVKKGEKVYTKGNYAFGTVFVKSSKISYLGVAGMDKKGYIKFFVKDHVKKNGKWKWDKWFKVKKGKYYEYTFPPTWKLDKIKVKYTHVSYKKIS